MKNLKVIELLEDLKRRNESLEVYIDSFVNYNESSYICDIITELADSSISIYSNDLLEWAKDNYCYIEDAIGEFGNAVDNSEKTDFIRTIQQGQYLAYNEEIYNNLSDYIKVYAYGYILNNKGIEELTNEQYKKLESELDIIDNNDTLDNIIDKINNILNNEK